MELAAIERREKFPYTYNGEIDVTTFSHTCGNEDMHKSIDVFEFWPDPTTDYEVSCQWASKK